jgi:ABC-type antimicrobial peptide transport system permease subunit
MVYRSFAQVSPIQATVVVRTMRAALEMATAVREAIRTVDPDVAAYDVRTMHDHLDEGNAFLPFRLGAFVTGLFGRTGLLLASIGLYGMIAYHVGQRTQEIGVRMALGARAADIIRDEVVHGGRFAIVGAAIGVVLAAGVAQLVRTLLFDVSPFDPLTYASVALVLVTVCLVASFVPAVRATTNDPLTALRTE